MSHFLPIMLLGIAPNSTILCFEINPIMLTLCSYFMLYSSIDYQITCNSKVTGIRISLCIVPVSPAILNYNFMWSGV